MEVVAAGGESLDGLFQLEVSEADVAAREALIDKRLSEDLCGKLHVLVVREPTHHQIDPELIQVVD